jgi:hypothetical protein
MLYLLENDYLDAFINAYLILRTEPHNLYQHKIIVKALYGLSKNRSEQDYSSRRNDYDNDYYESRDIRAIREQCAHMVMSMIGKDLTVLALRYAYYVHLKDTAAENLNLILNDLIYVYSKRYNGSLREISYKPYTGSAADSMGKTVRVQNLGSMRAFRKDDFSKYAFAGFNEKDSLGRRFDKYSNYKPDLDTTDLGDDEDETPDQRSLTSENAKNIEIEMVYDKKAYALGLNQVILLDPSFQISKYDYSDYDYYNNYSDMDYENSAKAELSLKANIAECANAVGLKLLLLKNKSLGENDVDMFNDVITLKIWQDAQLSHQRMYFVNFYREYALKVCDKYHIDQIATLDINTSGTSKNKIGRLLVSIVWWPNLPFAVYDLMQKHGNTRYRSTVSDVRKNKLRMFWYHSSQMGDSRTQLNSNIYMIFKQIKTANHVK